MATKRNSKTASKTKRTSSRTASSSSSAKKKSNSTGTIKLGNNMLTKSELFNTLSDYAMVSKKEVAKLFEGLENIMGQALKKFKEFNLPGLLKIRVKRKPATKARKGINPFTGEPTTFAAKPASNKVSARALKRLKEMAQ